MSVVTAVIANQSIMHGLLTTSTMSSTLITLPSLTKAIIAFNRKF